MTDAEWRKAQSILIGRITRAKTAVSKAQTLALKIEAKRMVRIAEEKLRDHRLDYHTLVDDPVVRAVIVIKP